MRMHVCMHRGCPSWSAHGIGLPTWPGGGAHQKWVECPNPAFTNHRSRVTHTGSYLHTRPVSVFNFLPTIIPSLLSVWDRVEKRNQS